MKRSLVFAVAAALSLAACADSSSPISTHPAPPVTPVSPSTMLAGRISVSGEGADRVVELRDDHGDRYHLEGSQTTALASVDGGNVLAFGTWDADAGFQVREFQVVAMHGRAALDGILEVSEEGFALRLANGAIRLVPGLRDCADYVGQRVWVVGWDVGSDVIFGLIDTA